MKNPIDYIAAFCVLLFVGVSFWDSLTSPITFWDGMVTWDKWATQWASRSNLYDSVQGGYPQLLPMFSSLLYKVSGNYAATLPADHYALHAFHTLLGLLLFMITLRAAQLFSLPAWGLLMLIFGFATTQQVLASGTADVMLTVFVFATVVLFHAWQQGDWDADWHGAPIFGLCVFGATFCKIIGFLSAVFILVSAAMRASQNRRLPTRLLAAVVVFPLVLVLPYYGAQYAADRAPISTYSSQEVNFRLSGMVGYLQDTSDSTYSGVNALERALQTGGKFVGEYSRGVPLPSIWGGLILLLMTLSGRSPTLRPVLITAGVMAFTWYHYTAYDFRNLLPALPLMAVCLVKGIEEVYGFFEGRRWAQLAFVTVTGYLAILLAAGLHSETLRTAVAAIASGNARARLRTANSSFPEKIRPFFAAEYDTWIYVSKLRLLEQAGHLISGSFLYRWHPHGIYPLSSWNRAVAEPGDLFIAAQWPPSAPENDRSEWTLVQSHPMRVWFWDKDPVKVPLDSLLLTGPSPPRLLSLESSRLKVEAGGSEAYVAYNLTDRVMVSGATVLWQVAVDADTVDPAVHACSFMYDPGIVDAELTRYSVDQDEVAKGSVLYSGVVVLRPGELSSNTVDDGVLFGLCRGGVPQPIVIKSFKYSLHRW